MTQTEIQAQLNIYLTRHGVQAPEALYQFLGRAPHADEPLVHALRTRVGDALLRRTLEVFETRTSHGEEAIEAYETCVTTVQQHIATMLKDDYVPLNAE